MGIKGNANLPGQARTEGCPLEEFTLKSDIEFPAAQLSPSIEGGYRYRATSRNVIPRTSGS